MLKEAFDQVKDQMDPCGIACSTCELGMVLSIDRWKVANRYELRLREKRAAENRPEELKEFLKIWVGRWLEKWRERVGL